MAEMAIHAIYPKPNISKAAHGHKVYPYLLRNAQITRPNQAWSVDIIYIRLNHGFVYLTAIIDWYSHCIVDWQIDDTLGTRMFIDALKKAFAVATPEILNSDYAEENTMPKFL